MVTSQFFRWVKTLSFWWPTTTRIFGSYRTVPQFWPPPWSVHRLRNCHCPSWFRRLRLLFFRWRFPRIWTSKNRKGKMGHGQTFNPRLLDLELGRFFFCAWNSHGHLVHQLSFALIPQRLKHHTWWIGLREASPKPPIALRRGTGTTAATVTDLRRCLEWKNRQKWLEITCFSLHAEHVELLKLVPFAMHMGQSLGSSFNDWWSSAALTRGRTVEP